MARRKNRNRRRSQDIDIQIPQDRWITREQPVFAIGSCFAVEIRNWLQQNQYNVLPLDTHHALSWYNTYTLADEFALAAQGSRPVEHEFHCTDNGVWVDPYRSRSAAPLDQLKQMRDGVDQNIINGVRSAALVVITLGLTECWKWNDTVICHAPQRGVDLPATFFPTTYEQNIENGHAIVASIKKANPEARVLISVSPVPLMMTFTDLDHEVANSQSKCTLRAVAAALAATYDHVDYFPSYEVVMSKDRSERCEKDGRHVPPAVVAQVMEKFRDTYVISE